MSYIKIEDGTNNIKKSDGLEYDTKKIVECLSPYKEKLATYYNWNTPSDKQINYLKDNGFIGCEQNKLLISEKNIYKRNVLLKEVISNVLYNSLKQDDYMEICEWIVREWGGIYTGDIKSYYERINKFLKQSGDVRTLDFGNIASISKILSFIAPKEYIIYDARVAYAMNWILLKNNTSNKFFPIPDGRNTKLNAFDLSTIIRLRKSHEVIQKGGDKKVIYNMDKKIFIEKSEAYSEMCTLIRKVNKLLWDDLRKEFPFYTEMLLFSLADGVIFNDIVKSCSLEIIQ